MRKRTDAARRFLVGAVATALTAGPCFGQPSPDTEPSERAGVGSGAVLTRSQVAWSLLARGRDYDARYPAAYEPQGNGQPSAASAPKEGAAQASPPKPVDYMKLQENLKLVTNTLDRFNQKLLRMIAQARAEQKRQQEAEASKEGKTTVAVDEKKD